MNDGGNRNARLTAKPIKPQESPEAYFRKILREYPSTETDERAIEFGVAPDESDFDRSKFIWSRANLRTVSRIGHQIPDLIESIIPQFIFDETQRQIAIVAIYASR